MFRTIELIICLMLGSLTAVICAASDEATRPLILAIHPYLPPEEIVSRFTPLANEIERAIDRRIEVRVGRSYREHIEAVGTDSVDIAYLGPASYVLLVAEYGNKPLLARQEINGKPFLRGEIFVRNESPLRTLADLRGKRFALGDPSSTMSLVPMAMLRRAGIQESQLASQKFLGSHRNVVLAVLTGDFDAGAVKEEVFQEFADRGIRSIATTPRVTDHIFVASSRLPVHQINAIRLIMLKLPLSVQGKEAMTAIHPEMSALVKALDSDYDNLRAILGGRLQRTR